MLATRRGFLGGLASLVAAPSIVRVESIMKVRPLLRYGPAGIITMQMIAEEAIRIYMANVGGRVKPASSWLPVPCVSQHHVDIASDSRDKTLPMETYSERYIAPAMDALARAAVSNGGTMATEFMNNPRLPDRMMAVAQRRNVPIRVIEDYNIYSDAMLIRFDIGMA